MRVFLTSRIKKVNSRECYTSLVKAGMAVRQCPPIFQSSQHTTIRIWVNAWSWRGFLRACLKLLKYQ